MQNISTLTKISQHVITSSSFHKLSILILLIQTCMQKAFFLKKKKNNKNIMLSSHSYN